MRTAKLILTLLLCAGFGNGSAALLNRGGGLIYDTDLGVTWLADANYAKTSGFSTDGRMSWAEALAWVANLDYAGFSGWRLPTGVDSLLNGYQCLGSEMCHLHYIELGGHEGGDIRQSHNINFSLFENIQGGYYWTETTHPVDTGNAFDFNFEGGLQSSDDKSFARFAWPVHPGDIGAIPEPSTLLLCLVAIAALGVMSRRRC